VVLQEFTVTVIRESCIQCHKGWTEEHLPIERAVPVRAEGKNHKARRGIGRAAISGSAPS